MNYKYLDLEYLHNISGGNYDTIKELANLLVLEVPKITDELQNMIINENWEGVRAVAHKSKSTLSIFGMRDLSLEMDILEKLAIEAKETHTYQEKLDSFKGSSSNAIEELNQFLASK